MIYIFGTLYKIYVYFFNTKKKELEIYFVKTFIFSIYRRLFELFIIIFNLLTVVNQFYEAEIMTEYVIRGNTAVLKCSIPSFVADFVRVESWIDEAETVLIPTDNYGYLMIYLYINTLLRFSKNILLSVVFQPFIYCQT